jgi:predicted RNA binding protein YcfA (HicA-like mRNA interferase family)
VSQGLPQASGKDLVKLLSHLGYVVVRQRGSHIRLRKTTVAGEHNITVPAHTSIAKGTLNDIFSKVSIWNETSKEELAKILKKQ